jgi:hypothetical protein
VVGNHNSNWPRIGALVVVVVVVVLKGLVFVVVVVATSVFLEVGTDWYCIEL